MILEEGSGASYDVLEPDPNAQRAEWSLITLLPGVHGNPDMGIIPQNVFLRTNFLHNCDLHPAGSESRCCHRRLRGRWGGVWQPHSRQRTSLNSAVVISWPSPSALSQG